MNKRSCLGGMGGRGEKWWGGANIRSCEYTWIFLAIARETRTGIVYFREKGVSEVSPKRQSAGDIGTLQFRSMDSVSVTVVQRE